jgi:hydroxyacylglutathione hydrolase
MLLRRFYDDLLAQASYLVGCQATGEALVVDPLRRVEPYLETAAREGLRITHVTETHIHADFVSGTRELAHRTGARPHLSDEGGPDWRSGWAAEADAVLLRDGDVFMVGNVRIRAIHTPGHTPEHLTFLVTDTVGADRPMGAFTGDFLFVGDVGRPDLLEKAANMAGTMERGARDLFRSLGRFRELDDWLQIWPGHGAGSACGKGLGAVPFSTLGYEKRFNPALSHDDESSFVRAVLEGQPDPPRYFAEMKWINRDGPRVLGGPPDPPLLGDEALAELLGDGPPDPSRGPLVVDVRPRAAFAGGHVPGTLNIPLDRSFVTWAGWLLPYDRDLYLIVDHGGAGRAAARHLAGIGLDRIEGILPASAIGAWARSGGPVEATGVITPDELRDRMDSGESAIVDVRWEAEWKAGRIPGSVNIPLGMLEERIGELPAGRPLVVGCAGGGRSAIAAGLLQARGIREVVNLEGGFDLWRAEGLPVETEEGVEKSSTRRSPTAEAPSPATRPPRLSLLLLLLLLLVAPGCDAPAPEAASAGEEPADEWTLIEGGWLLDVDAGERVPNPGVWISPDGRVGGVGGDGAPAPSDAAFRTVRLDPDHTLMPGLVDVHAHYNMDLTGEGRVEETRYNPLVFLANGVTTTWPGGEYLPEQILQLRDRIERGEWDGPRVIPSGPYFGSSRPGWDREITPERIRAEVDAWVERGVLHFKAKGAGPEHLAPLVERVHHHGGTVAGHVDSGFRGTTNSADAIALGIDRVEHILGGRVLDREQAAYPVWNRVDTTDAAFREVVRLFLDNEVFFDPTITAPVYFTELEEGFDDWGDERSFFTPYVRERAAARQRSRNELMSNLYQAMQRTTLAFYNAGGGPWITLGTDTPSRGEFLPGFSAHRELHALVLAGIPPMDALRAGTINGARALRMDDEIGSIAPGKWADMAVIRGDPLADIRHTRNVERVFLEGREYDPAALLERARGRIGPTGPEDHEGWYLW